MDDATKLTLIAKINAIREFVITFRSRQRSVEADEQGFLKVFQADVEKTEAEVKRAQRLYDQAVAKLATKQAENSNIRKWLSNNQTKFDELEGMLSDEAADLAKKLSKCV